MVNRLVSVDSGSLQFPEDVHSANIETPPTSINLIEPFGAEEPKVLRVRSSSTPGTGAGANAGRSISIQVADSRAKSMIDYQYPMSTGTDIWDFNNGEPPESAYESVAWFGVFHYWAQDQPDHDNPTDLHNHISILEMRDESGDLHTILDAPISPYYDDTKVGANLHRIRTNRSDLNVRVGNPYDLSIGRAFRLKIAGSTSYEKYISYHSNTSGETSGSHMAGVRWEHGVTAEAESGSDAGSNFVIDYFTDTGFSARRAFFYGDRATGKATFGKRQAGSGRLSVISASTTDDLFHGYPEAGVGAGTLAVFAAQVGSVGNKAFRTLVGSTTPIERFHVLGDGKMEWATSAGVVDTVLYRSAASILGTEDDLRFELSSKGPVLKAPAGTYWRLVVDNSGVLTTVAA